MRQFKTRVMKMEGGIWQAWIFFAENEEQKIITANLINFYLIILCDISSAIVLEATFNYNTNKSEI